MKVAALVLSLLLFPEVLPAAGTDTNRTAAVPTEKHQDFAFSLLMEAYLQMQGNMIEADYRKRLQVASLVKDEKQREQIVALATQERDARLARLDAQVQGFTATYDTSSPAVAKGSSTVAPEAVNDKLHTLVPFTPKNFGPAEDRPSQLLPAGAQMIYGERR